MHGGFAVMHIFFVEWFAYVKALDSYNGCGNLFKQDAFRFFCGFTSQARHVLGALF